MKLRLAPMRASIILLATVGMLCTILHEHGSAQTSRPTSSLSSPHTVTLPAQLSYGFEAGKVYHYKVDAIFSGQIPKLSEPGTDAHIKAELYYSATVIKHDASGAKIAFAVEAENLSFLTKDPGPNGKLGPDDVLPFPLPLAQVQGYLNVTALLRPDGSIAEVTGGNNDPVKIDVGVDLRKLFVLMLPVILPDHAVKPGQTWNFDEGFLGKKPGRTSYVGKMVGVREDSTRVVFELSQSAKSTVNDNLDKEGNSTQTAKLQVGTITGTVSAEGSMNFGASKPIGGDHAKPGTYTGKLISGNMTLSVALSRTMPDPDHPDKKVVDPITVRGRMAVQLQAGPPKLDEAPRVVDSKPN
jgi:hypothetical protein